jgi:hypothetical protein
MKLTTSEARAEACTVLFRLLLGRMASHDAAWLREQAMAEARNIGHADITEELEWIFHKPQL